MIAVQHKHDGIRLDVADAGSATLMDALGQTSVAAPSNEAERTAACDAYDAAWLAAPLPPFCGPINFDMNQDWPCKRLSYAFMLHSMRDDIDRTAARIPRARSERVVRNLTAWVADAEQRLARLVPGIAAHRCTCAEPAEYGSLADVPLPDCTC